MSHIREAKINVELKDEKTLISALNALKEQGYAVKMENGVYIIDLAKSKKNNAVHAYTKRNMGEHYSQIRIEKKENGYRIFGDPWSIEEQYNKTIKDLENAYTIAGLQKALNKLGFSKIGQKEKEKTLIITYGR